MRLVPVLALALTVGFVVCCLLGRPRGAGAAAPSRWRIAHHDVDGVTRVVLQRFAARGDRVLDRHAVAAVAVDDPEYDAKFLTAMAAARERRALFEAEEDRWPPAW